MKTVAWDRILGILGLIFAIMPWVITQATIEAKIGLTLFVFWFISVVFLILFNQIGLAWLVFGLTTVFAVASLSYLLLQRLSPGQSHVLSALGVLTVLLVPVVLGSVKIGLRKHQIPVSFPPSSMSEQFGPFVNDAEELVIMGLTLGELRTRCGTSIETMIRKQDCRLRVLLPDESVLYDSAYRIALDYEPAVQLKGDYFDTLAWLDQLMKQNSDMVQVRITQVLPTVSLLFVDPGSPKARLRACVHIYKGSFDHRPYFEFEKESQPEWYAFFLQRYTDLWEKGQSWEAGAKAQMARAKQQMDQIKRANAKEE